MFANPAKKKTAWMGFANKDAAIKEVMVSKKAYLVDSIIYAEEDNYLLFHMKMVAAANSKTDRGSLCDLTKEGFTKTFSCDKWKMESLNEEIGFIFINDSLEGLVEDFGKMKDDMLRKMAFFKEAFIKLAKDYYSDDDIGYNILMDLFENAYEAKSMILSIARNFHPDAEEKAYSIALTAMKRDVFCIKKEKGQDCFRISEISSFSKGTDNEKGDEQVTVTMKNGEMFKVVKKEMPNHYRALLKLLDPPSMIDNIRTSMCS